MFHWQNSVNHEATQARGQASDRHQTSYITSCFSDRPEQCQLRFPNQLHWEPKCLPVKHIVYFVFLLVVVMVHLGKKQTTFSVQGSHPEPTCESPNTL